MSEWLISIFSFIIYFLMKKPKTANKKPASKTKAEQSVTTIAKQVTLNKPSPKKKIPKKVHAVASTPDAVTPKITMPERVGLTAGSIWHYLAENGVSPVAKLVRELPEEEKIIQRSIGWLAQEGKITIESDNRVEIISLK